MCFSVLLCFSQLSEKMASLNKVNPSERLELGCNATLRSGNYYCSSKDERIM